MIIECEKTRDRLERMCSMMLDMGVNIRDHPRFSPSMMMEMEHTTYFGILGFLECLESLSMISFDEYNAIVSELGSIYYRTRYQ